MRSEECDPGPQHHHNTNRFLTAAVVELLLLWWTLPWHLETAAHNRPLKFIQSEACSVSDGPMRELRDALLFNGLRDEMMITWDCYRWGGARTGARRLLILTRGVIKNCLSSLHRETMCVPSFDVKMIVMRCCCVLLVTTAAVVMLWLYLRPSLALPSLLLSQIASTVRAAGTVSCERGIPQSHYWNLEFDMTEIWSYSKIMPGRINKAAVTRPRPWADMQQQISGHWAKYVFLEKLWVSDQRQKHDLSDTDPDSCSVLTLSLSWAAVNCNPAFYFDVS